MRDPPPTVIDQLQVTLRGISPLSWRRVLVSADTSPADLHYILPLTLGWTNLQLHRFLIHGKEHGIAYDGGSEFDDDPRQIRLRDFQCRLRERFLYEYDFGDHWPHNVRSEQSLTVEGSRTYPVCPGGKRATPPEECGGVEVYLAQWRRWQYDFLCHQLRGEGRDRERLSLSTRVRRELNQAMTLSTSIAEP
jgi:Plasmid pRiA4b ORF-3-like protein